MKQSSTTQSTSARPLRRDAAKNKEKLLGAALVVFAENGLEGSVEEVARVAGVGMGTLYRRFPTKQALIDELVGTARRELLTLARTCTELRDGTGLEKLLVLAGQLQAGKLGCLQRIWDHSDAELDAMENFRDIVRDLLADGQSHRRIRTDITQTDVSMILWSLRGVIETTRDIAPNVWRRHLDLLIAGIRPTHGVFADGLHVKGMTETQARRVTRTRPHSRSRRPEISAAPPQ
jgi:AcrR family transcriptional regulator